MASITVVKTCKKARPADRAGEPNSPGAHLERSKTPFGERRLLSIPQVAEKLSVSKSLVREYVYRGMLQSVKLPHPSGIGRINRTLIDSADVDSFILDCKGKTG